MSQHTTLTTGTGPLGLQSLLNPTQISEDARSTCGNSKYETSNAHLHSNGVWGSTANMHSTSEPRPTAQLFGPGQPMPTILPTSVGSMASLGGFSSANSSQVMNPPFPATDDLRRKPGLKQYSQVPSFYHLPLPTPGLGPCQTTPKFRASSAEVSYEYEALRSTRLQSMGSQPAIDAARGSPLPTSTAARSNSQPSMASFEAHIHPPPATTLSPRNVDWVQDPPTRSPDMPPRLGMPPPENATSHMPVMRDALFGVHEGQLLMNLPGSNDMMSVPVDVAGGSKEAQEKRKQNAAASRKHRKKMKDLEEETDKALKQLQEEVEEMKERLEKMEEEQNSYQDLIRDLIRQTPSLNHLVQASNFLSQMSNTDVGTDGLATRPQSYGGGSSPGERPPKRHRTDHVPEFSAPAYGDLIGSPTSRHRPELPPKQNPQDTSTRWFMSQDAGISTSSSMVASVR